MRAAIIGETGQLARALMSRAAGFGCEAQTYSRANIDLSQSADVITDFIDGLDVDAVIIAAAYTAVDKAEEDYAAAAAVNGRAPEAIAKACAAKDIALVHISTDYVFSGDAVAPYKIEAPTDPVNWYGRSKLMGEQAVLQHHQRVAALRTSWVFDGTGKNFMTTMLRVGAANETLNVVADQIGRPTYAGHLADAALKIAKTLCEDQSSAITGLYHVTGSGDPISWAEFAAAIFDIAADALPHSVTVRPIPSSDYPTPAKRPVYSVLDLSRYESQFSPLPNWQDGLKHAYKDWVENAE